ncbi:MAG: MoxR family ATPase [Bradymonadales bacterium]|nr:MoxR family ATPase [Bradymonadales bacterium]
MVKQLSSHLPEHPPPESVQLAQGLLSQVNRVLQGKAEAVELAFTCLLAGGHLLIEDVPGVGKTTLGRALARSIGGSFSRIQFTSDLLPADILGVTVFNQATSGFEFRPGPIFANILLADEINRTTPRTQSSLLQAMAEGQVSIDDVTHILPRPFLVIATQNPMEAHGTYPLPENQLDRFMMRLSLGYPELEVERLIMLERRREEPIDRLEAAITIEDLQRMQAAVDQVRVDDSIIDYLLEIVTATRRTARLTMGVSTRGALSLMQASRALAMLQGRAYVVPEDIRRLCLPVMSHRVSPAGMSGGFGAPRGIAEAIIEELLDQVAVPV